MKRKFYTPLLFVLCLSLTTVFAGDDKKAISETIDNEVTAFLNGDYDTWASYWVHEPYVSQTFVRNGMLNTTKSWDSLSVGVKKMIEDGDNKGLSIEKGNYDINVSGDMALVYATEKVTMDFLGEERKYDQISTNVFKKEDGKWKFVTMDIVNKSSFETNDYNTEMQINLAGYSLLWSDQIDKAIKVFEVNTQLFPKAFNTWDSLAEAYMKKGDNMKATEYYKKSLALNSKNDNAEKMIAKLEKE
jgi:tetratricopeptide (TPR) repeat protein